MDKFPRIQAGTYRHYKTKQLYEVLGVALATETNEPLVIYRPLYETKYQFFARPHQMFIETVSVGGKAVLRFEKVAD